MNFHNSHQNIIKVYVGVCHFYNTFYLAHMQEVLIGLSSQYHMKIWVQGFLTAGCHTT